MLSVYFLAILSRYRCRLARDDGASGRQLGRVARRAVAELNLAPRSSANLDALDRHGARGRGADHRSAAHHAQPEGAGAVGARILNGALSGAAVGFAATTGSSAQGSAWLAR